MNIFYLDRDPYCAARMMCNKHVCKMAVESAQLLCAAHTDGSAPYKVTHVNHPCAKWVRQSRQNYVWLCDHAMALINEYDKRYGIKKGRDHASKVIIEWCYHNIPDLPNIGSTPVALCMPDQYKKFDAVAAYRAFYIGEKARFAKWAPYAYPPDWWPFPEKKRDGSEFSVRDFIEAFR